VLKLFGEDGAAMQWVYWHFEYSSVEKMSKGGGRKRGRHMLMAVTSTFLRRRRSHHGLQTPFWYLKRLSAEKVPREGRGRKGRNMAHIWFGFGEDSAAMLKTSRYSQYTVM